MARSNGRVLKYGMIAVMALAVAGTTEANHYSEGSLKGKFSLQFHGQTSFAPFYDGTAGKTNSGIATAPRQDILRVGVMTADGKGNLNGRMISTTDDGVTTIVIDYNWTGSYSFSTNGDGTGTLIINAPADADINSCRTGDGAPLSGCAAFEGAETYAFVISGNSRQKSLSLTETDNAAGGAKIFLVGAAWTQDTQGTGGSAFSFPF